MTSSIFLRFVWKEYRTQRSFWLGVLALAFFGQLLILYFSTTWAQASEGLYFAALLAVPFYALGAGAVLFAGEREEGTDELLRNWAAPASRLLAGKLCFALLSSAALLAAMLILAWLLAGGRFPKYGPVSWDRPVCAMALMAFELAAWSLFWSCLTRRAVNAACWAAATWMAEIALVADGLTVPAGYLNAGTLNEAVGLYLRLPTLAFLLLVDAVLVARWLRPRETAWTELWSLASLRLPWPQLRFPKIEAAPLWRRGFKRLLWQEWRQSASMALGLIGIGVVLMVLFELFLASLRLHISGILIPTVVTLLGAMAFQGEQTGRRFTFLANRGIAPPAIWLSKQLVGLAWAGIAIAVFALVSELLLKVQIHFELSTRGHELLFGYPRALALAASPMHRRPLEADPNDVVTKLLLTVTLCFASGQIASLVIPRSVPAGFIALVITGPSLAWTFWMAALRVPLWIGAAPIAFAYLAASYMRTHDWLLERNHRRGWITVLIAMLLPIAALAGGTAVFRISELPVRAPAFDVDAFLADPLAPEEQATAALYREAIARLAPFEWRQPDPNERTAFHGWDSATARQREWFQKSQAALPIALEAAHRPFCVLRHPKDAVALVPTPESSSMSLLVRLIMYSVRQLEAEGKLEEALERYLAALHVAHHTAMRGDEDAWLRGNTSRAMVFDWMSAWMSHPQQSPKRLMAALRRLESEVPTFPSVKDSIKTTYIAQRKAFAGDWSWLEPLLPPDSYRFSVRLVRLFPWERQRTLQVVDWMAANRLDWMGNIESALGRQGASLAHSRFELHRWEEQSGIWDWSRSTLPLGMMPMDSLLLLPDTLIAVETQGRALLLKLALVVYRAEHGKLPQRLDELVDVYFDKLPLDPWSGRPFGYEPKGFPNSVAFGSPSGFVAQPGQPLLWSAGPGDARVVPRRATNTGKVTSVLVDGVGLGKFDSDHHSLGIAYPIP